MGYSAALTEMLARNAKSIDSYQAPPPASEQLPQIRASPNSVLVVSCADPRVFPDRMLGLDATLPGVAHVRNAGGRVFDEIRSLAALQTIADVKTMVVIHHTDCGMTHTRDEDVKKALLKIAPERNAEIEGMKFGEITGSIEESVREDVALLKASPLIKKGTQIVGLKFDLFTGKLEVVA